MKLRDIIIWVLFLIAVIAIIWYVFGSSPTFEQTILVFTLTILFAISAKLTDISSKLNSLEKSFINLAHDFKEHIKSKQR